MSSAVTRTEYNCVMNDANGELLASDGGNLFRHPTFMAGANSSCSPSTHDSPLQTDIITVLEPRENVMELNNYITY